MLRLILLVTCFTQVFSQFIIPEVKLEAFTPKGFRAYIPNMPGTQLFGFHGKVNEGIGPAEPGEITGDIKTSAGSYFMFVDPNLELHVGDTINYWVFIQYNRLGYRKDNLSWKVTELIKEGSQPLCPQSLTLISNGKKLCKGTVILEDNFDGLNTKKWTIEKYIPFDRPNFEFNYYDPSTVKIENSKLVIKPVVTNNTGIKLDLIEGCTSAEEYECSSTYFSPNMVHPVMSGRLTSKIKFRYGQVEIRAKLPAGDWIFPEISLIPVNRSNLARIWVAYARGNEDFHGNDGKNIGSNLLFGGPVLSYEEPARSSYLRSTRNSIPYTKGMHTYTLIWLPGEIRLLVDDIEYGKVNINQSLNDVHFNGPFDAEYELVIAVGVGGINDFGDGFMSGTVKKPWINKERLQIRNFQVNRNVWEQTWNDNALQVEYVKVTSV